VIIMKLKHHGIKGQKWGVRRYQYADGSLTPEGRKHYSYARNVIRNRPYTNDVNSIVSTLSKKEKRLLGADENEDWINKKFDNEVLSNKAKTFVTKIGDTPVSMLEIWTNGGRTGQIAIATRNDKEYRGKGYASKEVEKAIKWVNQYGKESIDELEWIAERSNVGSRRLAEKYGFEYNEDHRWTDDKYAVYTKTINRDEKFESTKESVKNSLSNTYKPFKRNPINVSEVRSRSGLNEADAKKCSDLATKEFNKVSKLEPRITKDIVDSVSKTSSKMYGLDFRLKQPTSMAGKIGSDAKEKDISFLDAAKGIKDAIRYTTVSNEKDFVKNYSNVKHILESKGYKEVVVKNYFDKYEKGEVMHKAVQCIFETPNGYKFEVQFQTPASQTAKELKLPIYEEIRKAGVSEKRAKELEQQMKDLAEKVPNPPNVFSIGKKK